VRQAKCIITKLDSYPYQVELRPGDPNVGMNKDIGPWLDENVKWTGHWTLESEGSLGSDNIYIRFCVSSIEDALLIKMRWQ
jgi:hypothetical protein